MDSIKFSQIIDNYGLKYCTPEIDAEKVEISTREVNRPALQLAGFFEHFDKERVQVIGNVECAFLDNMERKNRKWVYDKLMSNIQEIKARKGRVIAIVTEGDEKVKNLADEYIELPQTLECLEPLLATIPLQLLAYHIAICKGKDVDQPRNLAKSVTVE